MTGQSVFAADDAMMMSGPRPLPNEVWILIAAAAAAAKGRHGIDSPQAWQYDPHDHPLLALSQTSRTLRAITAPLLWTNISLTGYDHQDKLPFEHGIELIRKLVVCLQQPIIRNTIQSFNFDIELTTDSPDDFDEQPDHLGHALAGTELVNFRFLARNFRPSDGFLKAVGSGCPRLQHVELAYGPCAMPSSITLNEQPINGPEPLHALSQVRSATIGMGNVNLIRDLRHEDGWTWPLEGSHAVPYLVKWLRGEINGEPEHDDDDRLDNKLVNLKTSASFLYRHQCLLPAWARFNRIQEAIDTDDDENHRDGGAASFAHGELSYRTFDSNFQNALKAEDIPWVRAAVALRPALDRLLAENTANERGTTSTTTNTTTTVLHPKQVINMIRSDPIFTPWRTSWFPADTGGNSTPAYRESLLRADEIIRYWRKSAQSRREDAGPPARWATGWPEH
ncbi:hypothetical protein CF328_g8829 [Tilletia controversa]|nr:hypothetical protein CF328_g8829 [Tilletia controversa]